MRKHKQQNEIVMEGNGGGDTLFLKEVEGNNVSLEIGHCCVRQRIVLPVEVVTAILSSWLLSNNGSIEQSIAEVWRGAKQEWIDELVQRYKNAKQDFPL